MVFISALALTHHFLPGLGIHLSELPAIEWTHVPEENAREERFNLLVIWFCFALL